MNTKVSTNDGLQNKIFVSQDKKEISKLRSHERAWSFSLVGTGIGAGILYLGVSAGSAGLILLLIASAICYPLGYFSQKYFINLLIEAETSDSLNSTIKSFTGFFSSKSFTLVFSVAVFIAILAYGAGLNSLLGDVLLNNGITANNISLKPLFPFIILNILTTTMMFNEKLLISILEKLTLFLLFALVVVSILLIPNWNLSSISQINLNTTSIISHISFLIPMVVYSVIVVPALGPMVYFFRKEHPNLTKKELNFICLRSYKTSYWILAVFICIFTVSCILALTPNSITYAVENNISALAAIEVSEGSLYTSFLKQCGIIITLLALITSFYGCSFGFIETIASSTTFWKTSFENKKKVIKPVMGILLWFFITFNFSVINVIGMFLTPCVGYMYYILPGFIIRKRPELAKYKSWINLLIIFLGCFLIISFFIGLALQH